MVFPEDLDAAVQAATAQMLGHAVPGTDSSALRKIAARLAQDTVSLLASFTNTSGTRNRMDAAHIELAAHTLAAVADQELQESHPAEMYRTIAAGVTVLQRRDDGTNAPSETIILARA